MKENSKGLTYVEVEKRFVAKYPYVKDPNNLPNNRNAVFSTLKAQERKLRRDPERAILYQSQIDDMIERKVCQKVDDRELENYTGPCFYLSHLDVIKESSKSTKCRIVFHSSQKFCGYSLNDFLVKGPDMLNNLLSVLLRFREEQCGIVGDISKIYHLIGITEFDQMLHLLLWRNLKSDARPETYAIQVVNFGNIPSQTIAMCALQKTARLGEKDNPDAAKMISENSYMDDLVDSVANPEDAERLSNEVDEVLKRAGFRIKEWVISGDQHEATEGDDGVIEENVLGIKWNISNDEISCKTNIYSSKLLDTSNPSLTKRKILSYINGIYEPLGLVAPVTIKAKLMMRTLWTKERNLKWDDPVPSHIEMMWMTFFGELCRLEEVKFKSCIKPKDAVGKPELILFSDGSKESYGTAAYAVGLQRRGHINLLYLLARTELLQPKLWI